MKTGLAGRRDAIAAGDLYVPIQLILSSCPRACLSAAVPLMRSAARLLRLLATLADPRLI